MLKGECLWEGGGVVIVTRRLLDVIPFNLITIKSYLIGSDTHFLKYKTAFLEIQFICDRRIQCGTKHEGNSVFYMC